jgi:hypothetical protein
MSRSQGIASSNSQKVKTLDKNTIIAGPVESEELKMYTEHNEFNTRKATGLLDPIRNF